MPADIPLTIFAKEPVPGQVKTRMQGYLSEKNCARLAEQLLMDALRNAVSYWPGAVRIAAWPNKEAPFFQRLSEQYKIEIVQQSEGDLGKKMQTELCRGIEQSGAAAVVGADIPHITESTYRSAFDFLDADRDTVGPTEDGGFYFLGLTQFPDAIFAGISWGHNEVMQRLNQNVIDLDMVLNKLPMYRDIDEWRDLQWLARQNTSYRTFIDDNSEV